MNAVERILAQNIELNQSLIFASACKSTKSLVVLFPLEKVRGVN